MKTEIAFWDTSAIIPLYCNQVMSPGSRRIKRQYKAPVVWWGTNVEVHSGISRLLNERFITKKQSRTAFEKWNGLWSLAFIVQPDDQILNLAVSLTVEHNIRALDAFQLAAALVWCKEKPKKRPFICADSRLGNAAADAGFDVVSLV